MSFSNLHLCLLVNDSPIIFAVLEEVNPVECDEYFSISIRGFQSMIFHHLVIVLVLTALCGFL